MNDALKMVIAHETEERSELSRRIGFARGALEEALMLLRDRIEPDTRYWIEKDLRRALDELTGKTRAGKRMEVEA